MEKRGTATTDKHLEEEKWKLTVRIFDQNWELLSAVFDQVGALVIILNAEGRILLFNKTCELISGYKESEVKDKFIWDILFPRKDVKSIKERFLQLTAGDFPNHYDNYWLNKHGEERMISWSNTALLDEKEEILHFILVGTDITERVKTEENMRKLNKELEHQTLELKAINQELESFSYSVSHDLRSPLRSIDGFSQALLEDYYDNLDDIGKDFLVRIRKASQKMSSLIDDLLKLSRLTRSEMKVERVDLSLLAEEVGAQLKETDPTRQVTITICPNLTCFGDSHLLRIVLDNLFGNAWKFTSYKPEAWIEFGTVESDGEHVYFIKDNGAGFEMAYVDKLFGTFQRLHSTELFPGNGIGLATVQRIIERHGGRVWAEGEEDKGATFYFTLGHQS